MDFIFLSDSQCSFVRLTFIPLILAAFVAIVELLITVIKHPSAVVMEP